MNESLECFERKHRMFGTKELKKEFGRAKRGLTTILEKTAEKKAVRGGNLNCGPKKIFAIKVKNSFYYLAKINIFFYFGAQKFQKTLPSRTSTLFKISKFSQNFFFRQYKKLYSFVF